MADDVAVDVPADEPTAEPDASVDDGLGDAGKRALEAERKAARAAERKAKDLEKRLAEFEAATQTESEKAIAAARAEGRTEALSTANKWIIGAAIKAAASGVLANPDLAVRLIDASQFEVDEDGNPDTRAIAAEVQRLVSDEPYLAAGAKPAPLPGGGATPSQGSSMDDALRAAVRGGGGRL